MPGILPESLVTELKKIEPEAVEFTRQLPKIQSSAGQTYFVKSGSSSETEQYVGEAESLNAINTAAPGLAPKVLSFGKDDQGRPYFISEYKDIGHLSTKAAEALAKRMANELHQLKSTDGFGFAVPTYCGATRQKNGWYETWEKCYDAMIGNLLEGLTKKRGYDTLVNKGAEVRTRVIPKLLGPLIIQPVLLHGDLWSGNVGVDTPTGQPVIFDPSSYFGHNEADLAIARMFGGFPQSFYETYHKYHPKTEPVEQYQMRAELYELYHNLNHTLLFGGHYAQSASRIIDKLLSETSNL